MTKGSDFFQVGGTLKGDAPSYIERPADSQLIEALERREFCLVLGPRQMGKSSLMVHARARLQKKGVVSAVVDLQPLGSQRDPERWFIDVIDQIQRTAKLTRNANEWWKANLHLGPTQRFTAFLEDVLLAEFDGNVVLFVDEIDSVLKLPFSDDFFTTIRSLYNSRAIKPNLERLTVVLLGVATPSSFIKDRTRTPFNIGQSIALTDFSKDQTAPFREVLGPSSEQVVDRIFYWTNGQPLMVQKLAAVAYSWPTEKRTPSEIDREVEDTYLQLKIEKDVHFKFVQDYLLDASSKVRKVLSTYRDVLLGKEILSNERSSVQDRLKLAGVISVEKNGKLVPRNRIFQGVFNTQWVQEHTPVNLQKGVAYAASTALLLVLIGWLGGWWAGKRSDGSRLGRPLRVGVTSWPGYASGIVANEGFQSNKNCIYWNRYNQTVEFVLMEDPEQRSQTFTSGKVDIVWSTVDLWAKELPSFIQDGTKAKAIMQVAWSQGSDAIVVRTDIRSVEDLKGKTVVLSRSEPSPWLLETVLQNSALLEADQRAIMNGAMVKSDAPADFIAGRVDAVVVREPDVREALQRPGSHILYSSQDANRLIADIMVAREDFIRAHPDVIGSFIRGFLDGVAAARRDPEKVVRLLMDNQPRYESLGEQATRESLATVNWADLADNAKMFGLDGSTKPLFDTLFTYTSEAWLNRGYISLAATPGQAKEVSVLKEIYADLPVESTVPFKPADENVRNRKPIMTQRVNILFPFGGYTLDAAARKVIDEQVAILISTYSNAYIRIEGNTDDPGSSALNRQLSLLRAQEVADYLVEHYNFDRNRFIVVGNGPDKPIASNTTPEGRAANRRVDIGIVPAN